MPNYFSDLKSGSPPGGPELSTKPRGSRYFSDLIQKYRGGGAPSAPSAGYEKFEKNPYLPGNLQSDEPEKPIGGSAVARAAGAVPRLADYPEVVAQRNRQARETMSSGLEDFRKGNRASGIGEFGLGAVNYFYSPINAAFDVGVGQPRARATGSPKAGEYASFAAQLIANPSTIAVGLKHFAPEYADKLTRIFAPETRGPMAQKAAATIREEGAGEQAAAFAEWGEHRVAQNLMQSGAQAGDHAAGDGTRYTASARQFTDYLDGKGHAAANARVAAAADSIKPWYQKVRSRIEALPEGEKYHFLEEYFPIQISQKELRSPRAEPETGGVGGGASTGVLKGRHAYDSTSSAVDSGEATLKTADPSKTTYNYLMNAESFLARESVWQKAREDGIVKYFPFNEKVPAGLAKIEDGPHAQIHVPTEGARPPEPSTAAGAVGEAEG